MIYPKPIKPEYLYHATLVTQTKRSRNVLAHAPAEALR